MADKKLTDNEIIKALKICTSSSNGCSHSNYTCDDCYLKGQPMCSAVLHQDTIDLINRQQAEIEEMKREQFGMCRRMESRIIREFSERLRAKGYEVRTSRIKWVNRPIAAQYATVKDEFGKEHYGKIHDRIEKNPVGYCGECGKRLDDTFMNFCPNCGAMLYGKEGAGHG